MRKKLIAAVVMFIMATGAATQLSAAGSTEVKPVELAADTIEYDAAKGIMLAQGGVRITQGTAVLTGANALYNTKDQQATVTGDVKVVQENNVLTAQEVHFYGDHIIASGDAVLVNGDSRLTGPKIDYYPNRQYSVINGGARLVSSDAVMTADKLETFTAENKAVGSGNVHIVSDARKLDATAEVATYYGAKGAGSQGTVVLSGNARAVQEGNVLTGNTLTIHLNDRALDAQGRSKLVITPSKT